MTEASERLIVAFERMADAWERQAQAAEVLAEHSALVSSIFVSMVREGVHFHVVTHPGAPEVHT